MADTQTQTWNFVLLVTFYYTSTAFTTPTIEQLGDGVPEYALSTLLVVRFTRTNSRCSSEREFIEKYG